MATVNQVSRELNGFYHILPISARRNNRNDSWEFGKLRLDFRYHYSIFIHGRSPFCCWRDLGQIPFLKLRNVFIAGKNAHFTSSLISTSYTNLRRKTPETPGNNLVKQSHWGILKCEIRKKFESWKLKWSRNGSRLSQQRHSSLGCCLTLSYLLSWAGIYHAEFMRYSDEIWKSEWIIYACNDGKRSQVWFWFFR